MATDIGGWVSGFKHDIFISYARVDNATADGDPGRGWVAQFHRHLEVMVSKKVGRLDTVKIWRDTREIHGNKLFDRTIQDAVQDSAVFVALTSHGYLQSEYCRQELDWFHEKARKDPAGLAAGDDYRIFNLLLNNIRVSDFPPAYGRTSGFRLHDSSEPDRDGETSDTSTELFRAQLRSVVDALYETLTRLRGRIAPPAAPRHEESTGFRIYLADTSDTLASVRKRVLTELRQLPDLEVVANVPPPFEGAAHDERVSAELKASDLSVHLLDAFSGREVMDQEGTFYPQRQVELALEHSQSQLIWVPQGLSPDSIEDERHAAFLHRLEHSSSESSTYDFQREMPSSITRQILAKIEEVKSRREVAASSSDDAMLLDTHMKDQFHAFELGQYLLKHHVQPYINPQEDDPGKNLNLFSERLRQVAALIIFYGAVTEEWVRARLALALQIAVAEGYPLRACGVYIAPPHKPNPARKLSLPLVPVEWMDHTDGFNSKAVDHLLARARAVGGGQ